ncbi:MAG: NADH-quinone oxidoreductase subunit NuoF [Candidatus Electryonea clarkiae]|nr:NADH-quinone oxidoreductase subunit NuoF [Candidatus Electryonea clarkiae]MDP8288279.1 NADH-quinone oxidoreductase subunit NuoF [Candidatus Electryonea clarkiae]
MALEKIVFKGIDIPGNTDLKVYEEHGGYEQWKKILKDKITPEEVIEIVKKSGLRGRGGAGFPTGLKWSFVPQNTKKEKYLLCNCDESEPGTFKDREIIEKSPHQLIEGMLIAAYAFQGGVSYIYFRGEFVKGWKICEAALAQAREAGYIGENILGSGWNHQVWTHRGAGAYICGEETALINSMEGKRGEPRIKPPFPAVEGFYKSPTIVNNVETLTAVPKILENGPEWYHQWGTERSTGTKLWSCCGHISNPGVYEVPMGYSMKKFFEEELGGVWKDRALKAVIPGGSSTPAMTPEEFFACKMDYESIAEHGSMLGSGGMIVMDDQTCLVEVAEVLAQFYHHESCGQCTPCREGTGWVHRIIQDIERGQAQPDVKNVLFTVFDEIFGNTICPLGDSIVMPIKSLMDKWPEEFDYYIKEGKSKITGKARRPKKKEMPDNWRREKPFNYPKTEDYYTDFSKTAHSN